nr:PsiF family protein [Hydrogenophaga electricum]
MSNAPATPQERMKSCNTEATAKALTGDARKQFMGTCLKG